MPLNVCPIWLPETKNLRTLGTSLHWALWPSPSSAQCREVRLYIYTFIFPLFYKREYTCMCYINNYQTIIIHLYNNHKHNRSRCRVVLSLTTPCLHRTLHLVQYYNYIRVHLQVSWKDCTIYKHIP